MRTIGRLARSVVLMSAMAWACVPAAGDERTERLTAGDEALRGYLQRLGLRRLAAEELAARIEVLTGERDRAERVELAERLGRLYVELLNSAETAGEVEAWEARSRALLERVPEASGFELRISLGRALYLKAEATAERWRMRLASVEEKGEAEGSLRGLEREFTELARGLQRRVEVLERAEDAGDERESLRSELSEGRRLRSLAHYYAGWSGVYVALLSGQAEAAEGAMRSFGWLLNAVPGRPASVERLPAGLLRYPHIARAAVGCGLASSLRGNHTEAARWLSAVEENPETAREVLEQLPQRKIVVLGAAKRWADLERMVRRAREQVTEEGEKVEPLGVWTARLLAVVALEADDRSGGEVVKGLATVALGDLITRGQAAQVLDLAERYGTAPMGDAGFIVHYVRGLKAFDRAREAHGSAAGEDQERPARSVEVVNLYGAAGDMLAAALSQADAGAFKPERARTQLMLGRARFFAGAFVESSKAFRAAWESYGELADGARAEEALWLTVVALDQASQKRGASGAGAGEWGAERDETAGLFLRLYPESERGARLVLMRAGAGGAGAAGEAGGETAESRAEAVRVLLAIGRDSPLYVASRRQAARLLYAVLRGAGAGGGERDFAALRFVGVAEELLALDTAAALDEAGGRVGGEARAAAERGVVTARQVLDALLGGDAPDVARAARALETLEALAAHHGLDLSAHRAELTFRRVQIAMIKGDAAVAEALADGLAAGAGEAEIGFARAADRMMYRWALTRWREGVSGVGRGDESNGGGAPRAERVVRYGVRVIEGLGKAAGEGGVRLNDAGVQALYSNTAGAAFEVWKAVVGEGGGSGGGVAMRDLAMKLDRALLAVSPRAIEPLRRLSAGCEDAGETACALECWTTILAAQAPGTTEWFEARYQAARLLSGLDAERARELLRQHARLYPGYGPPPWGERLRELHARLGGLGAPVEGGGGDGGGG